VHSRVMGKRAPVDVLYAKLEDLLRERIELLYDAAPQDSELFGICESCVDLDYNAMVSALPAIILSMDDAAVGSEDLDNNAIEITTTVESLNTAISVYNETITRKPSAALMAMALGLGEEDSVELTTHKGEQP